MDLLSSLAKFEPTRLEPNVWLSGNTDLTKWNVDSWGNYVVLILARILNLLCRVRQGQSSSITDMLDEWHRLSYLIQTHKRNQSAVAYQFAIHAPDPTNSKNPFKTACYMSDAACSSQQMFHLAFLLLDLAKPFTIRSERFDYFVTREEYVTDVIHHISSFSVANRREVTWVNAIQFLHTVSLALVGGKYRKALLQCLVDIGVETGWNTKRTVAALLKWWGWDSAFPAETEEWRNVQEDTGPQEKVGELSMRAFEDLLI